MLSLQLFNQDIAIHFSYGSFWASLGKKQICGFPLYFSYSMFLTDLTAIGDFLFISW